jgi:rhodanese-related sulfurtransferase
MPVSQIAPEELQQWLSDAARPAPLLLDVREEWEYQLCCIDGTLHIPMGTVPARSGELAQDRDIVVICHHGGRSMQVATWLERNGFDKLHNLAGGMDAWARRVDASMAVY